MSLLSLLFGSKPKSAEVAKERLQIILARERTGRSAPDFLPALQKDLVEVILRYVTINPEDIKVSLERQDNYDVIEVNIVVPEIPAQPVSCQSAIRTP
ncbi:MAG: cell division topological specificity factor MinE [Comamonadaceae bacterium]|jgi:cell division topological specificity factor|nr:cell division topological specificity factor MinE [Comamonadaceae bacterium]